MTKQRTKKAFFSVYKYKIAIFSPTHKQTESLKVCHPFSVTHPRTSYQHAASCSKVWLYYDQHLGPLLTKWLPKHTSKWHAPLTLFTHTHTHTQCKRPLHEIINQVPHVGFYEDSP